MPVAVGPPLVLNTGVNGSQFYGAGAVLNDGRYVAVWTDHQTDDVKFGLFDATGAPVFAETTVASALSFNGPADVVALQNGGFFVVWSETDAIGEPASLRGRVYESDGVPTGADFHIGGAYPSQEYASATVISNGDVVVAWGGGAAQIFHQNGIAAYSPFQIGATAELSSIQVAALDFGRFVVTWREVPGGSAPSTIKARVFDQPGLPVGPAFTVSSSTGLFLGRPSVAALETGGFVVAWSMDEPNDAHRVFMRRFDVSGQAVGSDILVANAQLPGGVEPGVIALADGRLLVAWATYDASALTTLMGRIMTPTGTAAGPAFVIGEVQSTDEAPQLVARADGTVLVMFSAREAFSFTADVGARILNPLQFTGTFQADSWIGGALGDLIDGSFGSDTLFGGAGADTLIGGGANDVLHGEADGDRLYGQSGADTLNGGSGVDLLAGGEGADRLDGGSGLDTASYLDDGAVTVALDGSLAATGNAVGDVFISIENLSGSDTGGDTLAGDANANMLIGNGGNDSLSGKSGGDNLQGGLGNDTLVGGAGVDALDGGGGNDHFVFYQVSEGGDGVRSFDVGDKLVFWGAAFGGLPAGPLSASRFHYGTTNSAGDSTDRFIYRTTDDTLWYDADGTGSQAPILMADLVPDYSMTAADILIV